MTWIRFGMSCSLQSNPECFSFLVERVDVHPHGLDIKFRVDGLDTRWFRKSEPAWPNGGRVMSSPS